VNLKISDISDLYDATTETYTYQFDFLQLEDDYGASFQNFAVYKVRVTPRQQGGVDLQPFEDVFQFSCMLPDCVLSTTLPCEEFPDQCIDFVQ